MKLVGALASHVDSRSSAPQIETDIKITGPVAVWMFRSNAGEFGVDELRAVLKKLGKKYAFQFEKGDETGYEHWRGQVSLIKKKRHSEIMKLWNAMFESGETVVPFPNDFRPKATCKVGDEFYVMKADTRVHGPYTDRDVVEADVPCDTLEMVAAGLYPWQQYIVDSRNIIDDRVVDVIIDTVGNSGKRSIFKYCGVYGYGKKIPLCYDFKDMMRMVMRMPVQKMYFIDMRRVIDKEQLCQMYAAIDKIKGGYAFDDRYSFKYRYFTPPRVWVCTNKKPDVNLLSADRWRMWQINRTTKELEPYVDEF
nr:viral replication protein-like protein [Oceanusvirus sp.]